MIALPTCRWRGAVTEEGHHECASPKITHPPQGVRDELCLDCALCNHEPPPADRPRPLRVRQVWSAAMAYARWAAAGCPRPGPEQLAERKAACEACPHLVRGGEPRCGLCGCPINKVAHLFGTVERPGKAEMSTETCPDHPGCGAAGCPGVPRWKPLL